MLAISEQSPRLSFCSAGAKGIRDKHATIKSARVNNFMRRAYLIRVIQLNTVCFATANNGLPARSSKRVSRASSRLRWSIATIARRSLKSNSLLVVLAIHFRRRFTRYRGKREIDGKLKIHTSGTTPSKSDLFAMEALATVSGLHPEEEETLAKRKRLRAFSANSKYGSRRQLGRFFSTADLLGTRRSVNSE